MKLVDFFIFIKKKMYNILKLHEEITLSKYLKLMDKVYNLRTLQIKRKGLNYLVYNILMIFLLKPSNDFVAQGLIDLSATTVLRMRIQIEFL